MGSRGVYLMTTDVLTERSVLDALRAERTLAVEKSARSLQDLLRQLKESAPPVALVDVDPDPAKSLGLLEPVISRYSDTRFVMLGTAPSQDMLLEAMQVGARHFLAKEAISADLAGVLNRILPASATRRKGTGAIISVLQASGGVGATLLSVNLANELRLLTKEPTLLLDMDSCCGGAAVYLGLEPSYSLDVVLADESRIDGELIKSSAAVYNDNLYVLESPSTATRAHGPRVHYSSMPRFLEVCKEAFPFTVIDAPRLPLDVAAEVVVGSQVTLVPFEATVAGINCVKRLMAALIGQGCSADMIIPVINRYKKRGVLVRYEDVCRALSRDDVGRIENDWEPAAESINFGKPLAQHAPRSAVRKGITSLAEQLQTAHAKGGGYKLAW